MALIEYVCPIHNDVVLFVKDSEEDGVMVTKLMTFDDMKKCDECDKSYFIEQCVKKED